MKILLIASLAESLLNFRGPLITALQARHLEVHVAAPDLCEDSPLRKRMEAQGLTVHDIPLRRTGTSIRSDVHTLFYLWRLMRRIAPNYVLGYTIKPVIYGSLAAWFARVPSRFALITGLGYAFQGEGRRRLLERLVGGLYGVALLCVDKVFFQNPDDEALFRDRRILKENVPSHVVNGSGVDLSKFTASPVDIEGPRFLLIARLLGDKGVREYCAAAAEVRNIYPKARFALAGWIDDNPDAISKQELDTWVRSGTVEFLGRLDDVRPAIKQCSVYVLPSYREGTPRTVLEAMAMGRSIITTDAPGCKETVADGVNGILVPVRSVSDLANAMLRFIEQPNLAAEMGRRSRELAEEKYDVHKVNHIMLREMNIV